MIISRYITREIVNTLFAITLILLLALLCQQVVRYLNYVAVGKIPTNVLLELVSFEIPYLLALLFPLNLYLSILLAYGRLYVDNEMSILQMCGFGNGRLIQLTFVVALLVSGIVLILMLWVNPFISAKRQQVMKSDEATLHLIQTLIPGRFQASPDGRHVMYVEKLSRERNLAENVFLAQEKKNSEKSSEKKNPDVKSNEQSSWMLVLANQGYQIKDKLSQDQFFVTADGYRYEGTPGQNDYQLVQFKKYAVRIPQNDTRVSHQEDETLSISELWQDYSNSKRAAEFQWRFSIAIATFLLALLAVPMSTVRPRQGRYLILLPAVLVYITYIQTLFIVRHWVEQGMIPISIGMWWVHGIMLLIVGILILMNAKPWTRIKVGSRA